MVSLHTCLSGSNSYRGDVFVYSEETLKDKLAAVDKYISSNGVLITPPMCHPSLAPMMHEIMMTLFVFVARTNGTWGSSEAVHNELISQTTLATAKIFTSGFDDVVGFLAQVVEHARQDACVLETTKRLLEANISADVVLSMRFQAATHVLKSLGAQCTTVKNGPLVSPTTYLLPHVHCVATELNDAVTRSLMTPSARPVMPIFSSIQLRLGCDFAELFTKFFKIALDHSTFASKHDGQSYKKLTTQLREELVTKTVKSNWQTVLQKHGLSIAEMYAIVGAKGDTIGASTNGPPKTLSSQMQKDILSEIDCNETLKKRHLEAAEKVYAAKNANQKTACEIIDKPYPAALATMTSKYDPPSVAAADASDATATPTPAPQTVYTIEQWRALINEREQTHVVPDRELKELLQKLNAYFTTVVYELETSPAPRTSASHTLIRRRSLRRPSL